MTEVGIYCMASYFIDRLGSALTAGLTSVGVFLVSVGLLGRLWLALARSPAEILSSANAHRRENAVAAPGQDINGLQTRRAGRSAFR